MACCMRTPTSPRLIHLLCFAAGTVGFGSAASFGHEVTRAAYETALDPREAKSLAQASSLRAATPPAASVGATCQFKIRLLDAETQKPLPGLVRIRTADGRAVPLAGLVSRGTKLRADHPAKDWFALLEATTIAVPQAMLTIEAFAGLDTEMARISVDLSSKAEAQAELSLKSFFRGARSGWFGGNTHLHLSGLTRAQADEYLRALPRADALDLLFVSYLERAQADRDYISNGYTLADLQGLGTPGLLFGNGEEHRHNFEGFGEGYGHVMFLNIRQLVRPVSIGAGITGQGPDWPPLRRGLTQARGDGATIIWCHNTFGHEDTPDWLAGLPQAHNIFDGGVHGRYEDTFYRYLNIGLKVPFSTGTDWFIYDFARVYARLDKSLNVDNWLAALKSGRTFISNGPLLELRAGANDIGDTIRLSQPTRVSISGQAKGRHDFKQLEIVHNGRVVHSVTNRPVGGHFEATVNFSLNATEPGWIALRVPENPGAKNEMGETLFAHTSPIYVEFGGKSTFQKDAAEALIADMDSALKTIPAKAKFADDTQRDEVLKIYRDGTATLRRRLSE